MRRRRKRSNPLTKDEYRRPSKSFQRLKLDQAEPYQNLANAIICVAADDFRYATSSGDFVLLEETLEFFNSKWYATLTTVEYEVLLKLLYKELEEDDL